MCGIAGFIDPYLNPEHFSGLIGQMLESIRHRGPDNTGHWINREVCLGHNRLSIIDIQPASHQPFHYGDLVITYNGEIYNYLELREELKNKGYAFRTASDTEVILAAYREWGKECMHRFIGMWAFAIWDNVNRELFCSRDRFGIKPFYYIHENGRFYFGSEYKPLKLSPVFDSSLNHNHIYRGLQLGWATYKDETYFKNIKCLPPAHNLLFREGKVELCRYWEIDPAIQTGNPERAEEKFRELFLNSIKIHMRSDTTVGGCLSGGLDSSSIASTVSTLFPDSEFKTFHIYYTGADEVDERPWAEAVTEKYKNIRPYFFTPAEEDIREHMDKMMYYLDVPPAGSSPLSQYFVMRLAREQGMKVLLDGQGADEYLAGYNHSFYRYCADLMREMKLGKLGSEINQSRILQNLNVKRLVDIMLKSFLAAMVNENSLYRFEYKNYFPFLPKEKSDMIVDLETFPNDHKIKLNQFLYNLTFNTSLPTLLHNEDRNSMAFSIESRVPFLDHRLVELVFTLKNDYKHANGWSKSIMRKGLNGILPEKITSRTDKKGFVTPGEVKWLRGPLKGHVDSIVPEKLHMLDGDKVKSVVADYRNGNNKNAKLVWRIAMLNRWMDTV